MALDRLCEVGSRVSRCLMWRAIMGAGVGVQGCVFGSGARGIGKKCTCCHRSFAVGLGWIFLSYNTFKTGLPFTKGGVTVFS
jgi:hypothetical protein